MSDSEPAVPSEGQGPRPLLAVLVLAGGVLPLALHLVLFGWIPTLTPPEAMALLTGPAARAVLVDVRPPEQYAAGHVEGALNHPLAKILTWSGPSSLPAGLEGRTLLLICNVGMSSRWAAIQLARGGVRDVFNVRGGVQEWARSVSDPPRSSVDRWRVGTGPATPFPYRASPVAEQVLAVVAYLLVKPVYTILSAVVVVLLWRASSPDLVALRWALVAFFLGENACAVSYVLFEERSYLWEFLHCFGMLACFGLTTWASLRWFHHGLLGIGDPGRRCAATDACGRCVRAEGAACNAEPILLLAAVGLFMLSVMLPTADPQLRSYGTHIFGRYHHYAHLAVFQFFENGFCALAAMGCFAATVGILSGGHPRRFDRSLVAFSAGAGFLGFGLLRMVLGGAYGENWVFALFWEEATEFVFIATCLVLILVFRTGESRAIP